MIAECHALSGKPASRNLSFEHARFPFLAFLDANDRYLPNRFTRDKEILLSDPATDGVYGATGIHYEDEDARKRFHEAGYAYQEFTTICAPVPPEELFAVLFHQHPTTKGEFHTDAITIRRSLLDRVGGFHPDLRLQQDTHLWKRLAACGRLASGTIDEPIAIRGVHGKNRMTDQAEHRKYHQLWWESLRSELRSHPLSRENRKVFGRAYTGFLASEGPSSTAFLHLIRCLLAEPYLFRQSYGFFDLKLLEMTRSHRIAQRFLSAKNRLLGNQKNEQKGFIDNTH